MLRSLLLLLCSTLLTACGAHDVPLVLLPFAMVGNAIDSGAVMFDNTNFHLQGTLVDENNKPLDDVEACITTWTASHRDDGMVDHWDRHTEIKKLGSKFDLQLFNCEAVELRLIKPGYVNQRAIFSQSNPPPSWIEYIDNHDDDCDCKTKELYIYQLRTGGTFYRAMPRLSFDKRDIQFTFPTMSKSDLGNQPAPRPPAPTSKETIK